MSRHRILSKEVKMACDYVYVGYVNIFRHDNKLQGKKTGPVLKSTYYHCKKLHQVTTSWISSSLSTFSYYNIIIKQKYDI